MTDLAKAREALDAAIAAREAPDDIFMTLCESLIEGHGDTLLAALDDAERYRWLRDHKGNNRVPHVTQYPFAPEIDPVEYPYFTVVGLDAAIDAARSEADKGAT